jgi:hypothetical protein
LDNELSAIAADSRPAIAMFKLSQGLQKALISIRIESESEP